MVFRAKAERGVELAQTFGAYIDLLWPATHGRSPIVICSLIAIPRQRSERVHSGSVFMITAQLTVLRPLPIECHAQRQIDRHTQRAYVLQRPV